MKSTPTTITANEFGTSATKVEPSSSLESAGYLPAQQLPAEHMNWFMSLLTRLANVDNPSLRDVWGELNNVLAAASLTPDNTTVTQVKAALDALYLLKSAYGTGWLTTVQTALGANWQTALAATAGSGILTELKKVDGSGSGLDADLLRGAAPTANWLTAIASSLPSDWLGPLTASYSRYHAITGSVAISDIYGGSWIKSAASSSLYTLTLPLMSTVADGTVYAFHNKASDSYGLVVQVASGDTMYTAAPGNVTSMSLLNKGDYLTVRKVSGIGWIIEELCSYVGSYQTGDSVSASGVWADAGSGCGLALTLPPGIWEVSLACMVYMGNASKVYLQMRAGAATTFGPTLEVSTEDDTAMIVPLTIPPTRINIASSRVVSPYITGTTSCYLQYRELLPTSYGLINAVRIG